MTVDCRVAEGADALPPVVEEVLWRVVQEGLTNVEKHAHAQHVEVNLAFQPKEVVLRVTDDGVGLPPDYIPWLGKGFDGRCCRFLREVLVMLAQGIPNKEIADKLHLAEGTVKNHVSNILGKLQAQNRTEAADIARRRGLI